MTTPFEPPRPPPTTQRPAPLQLPPATQRFLRARRGSQLECVVRLFHAWLGRRRLRLADVTPYDLRRFLAQPRHIRLAPRTRYAYWTALRRYLEWLRDCGLVGFDPEHLRQHPKRLPACACEFLASLAPTRRPGTCLGYTTSLRRFHAWLERQGRLPQHLSRREISDWFQHLHAAGLHPSTRLATLFHVRAYLHWLAERHAMFTHPDELVRRTDLPKLPSYLPRPLSPELDQELKRRLARSPDIYHQGLLLMRHTGLRIGELRALEYECLRRGAGEACMLKVPLGKMNN